MKDLERIAALSHSLAANGEAAALATLVDVEGSSYRRPGSRMLITASGRTAGGVSAGCLEADVIEHALRSIASGTSRVVTYDTVADSDVLLGLGMGCGGTLTVTLEPLAPSLLAWLIACGEPRDRPAATATIFAAPNGSDIGLAAWLFPNRSALVEHRLADRSIADRIDADLRRCAATSASFHATYDTQSGTICALIQAMPPPPTISIYGAGEDARPLCTFARELGWRVFVTDIRSALLSAERFPEATATYVGEFDKIGPIKEASTVIMTHNFRNDLDILRRVVPANPPYIGLLGARHRTLKLLDELRSEGAITPETDLSALHFPAGLDIGSDTPESIALSIIAEISAVLHGRDGRSLKERQ